MKQHGKDAPIHAAMLSDAMLEAGDLDGYAVWKRVLRAVEELQGTELKSGDTLELRCPWDRCDDWALIFAPQGRAAGRLLVGDSVLGGRR